MRQPSAGLYGRAGYDTRCHRFPYSTRPSWTSAFMCPSSTSTAGPPRSPVRWPESVPPSRLPARTGCRSWTTSSRSNRRACPRRRCASSPVRRRLQPLRSSPQDVEHKLNVLRRHCDDVGRDYDTIRKTVSANNPRHTPETRDDFVALMADYAKLGVQTAITMPTSGSPAAWIDGMAPAFQQLADLG